MQEVKNISLLPPVSYVTLPQTFTHPFSATQTYPNTVVSLEFAWRWEAFSTSALCRRLTVPHSCKDCTCSSRACNLFSLWALVWHSAAVRPWKTLPSKGLLAYCPVWELHQAQPFALEPCEGSSFPRAAVLVLSFEPELRFALSEQICSEHWGVGWSPHLSCPSCQAHWGCSPGAVSPVSPPWLHLNVLLRAATRAAPWQEPLVLSFWNKKETYRQL